MVLYSNVVHYEENDILKDIDNSLSYKKETDEYENKANSFKIKFPKEIKDNKEIKLTYDQYKIDWNIANINTSEITIIGNEPRSNIKELSNISQTIIYKNVLPSVDIEYIITGNKIKENIILNEYIKDYSITFNYKVKDLEIVIDENDSILFVNDNNDVVFQVDKMFMFDKNMNQSELISYKLEQVSKSQYTLAIIPNEEWLKEAEYPVVIDPTISHPNQSFIFYDTYISSNNPDTNYNDADVLNIAYENKYNQNKALICFDFPIDVIGKTITYAKLTFFPYEKTSGRYVKVYQNTETYDSTSVTWNTAPSYDSRVVDYYHIQSSSSKYDFDITRAVKTWIGESDINNRKVPGFTITNNNTYTSKQSIYSQNYSDNGPIIEIGYIEPAGIKDYWTYHSQDIGVAGNGYVSDYTGYLNFIRNDLDFTTEKQSLQLSMIYDITFKDSNMGYGVGWRTNYNIYYGYDSYLNLYYTIDGSGNKVYYYQNESDDQYLAEDGSGNILVVDNSVGTYLQTRDDVVYHFGTDSFLDYILDKKTNLQINITRNNYYKDRIEQIIDSTGNKIQLIYTNGNLSSASLNIYQSGDSYQLLEKVEYFYSDDNTKLIQVKYYKKYKGSTLVLDDTVDYEYDEYSRVNTVTASTGEKINYTYNPAGKITLIYCCINTSPFYSHYYFYNYNQTIIINHNEDYEIISFDDYGHTVQTIDNFGTVQRFEYLNLFSVQEENGSIYKLINGIPNYYNNHKVISRSSPEIKVNNHICNHSFDYDQTFWEVFVYGDYDGELTERAFALDNNAILGEKCARLYGFDYPNPLDPNAPKAVLQQTVILDKGSYKLSGYIKNNANSNNVYIDVEGQCTKESYVLIPNDDQWHYTELSLYVANDNTEINVKLVNDSLGNAYFDNFQLISGFKDTRKNFIDNSSFEKVDENGSLPYWAFSSSNISRNYQEFPSEYYYAGGTYVDISIYDKMLDNHSIKIDGTPSKSQYAYLNITEFLDFTKLNGKLYIGCWGKSEGSSTSLPSTTIDKYFRVRIDVVSGLYPVDTVEYEESRLHSYYLNFDSNFSGWQYNEKTVSIQSSSNVFIYVLLEYCGEGSVYFDNLQVFYEKSGIEYKYDKLGRIQNVIEAGGKIKHFEYETESDFIPSAVTVLKDGQTVSTIEIDKNDKNLISEIVFNNVKVTPTYNEYGQVTQTKYGDEHHYNITSTVYSQAGFNQYIEKTIDQNNIETLYFYNYVNGLLKYIRDSQRNYTHFIYDNEGKLVNIINHADDEIYNGKTTDIYDSYIEYQYDENDRLTRIHVDDSNYYEMIYDNANRISEIKINNTPIINYDYYVYGNYCTDIISSKVFGNGDTIRFIYNEMNQIEYVQFKESDDTQYINKFSYYYDQVGNIALMNAFENGVVIYSEFYTYDSANRLIKVVDHLGNYIHYDYDELGNLTELGFKIVNEDQSNVIHNVNYHHNKTLFFGEGNPYNTLSTLYDKTTYTTRNDISVTKNYNYEGNALYRLESINLIINFSGQTKQITQGIVYDGDNPRIQKITYDIGNDGIDFEYHYKYNSSSGNISEIALYEGQQLIEKHSYIYDSLNRLENEDVYLFDGQGFSNFYTYDKYGNLLSVKTYDYLGGNGPMIGGLYVNSSTIPVHVTYNNDKPVSTLYFLSQYEQPSLNFTFFNPNKGWIYPGVNVTLLDSNLDTNNTGYYYSTYNARSSSGINITFIIRFVVNSPIKSTITYYYDLERFDQLTAYDIIENGITTSKEIEYDGQGNPIHITNFNYKDTLYSYASLEWEGRQLKSINIYDSDDTVVATISYTYNDQGYRISKSIIEGSNVQAIQYKLSGDKVIYESDGVYEIVYTYDIDGTLISFNYNSDISLSKSGDEYFYIRNIQGDIVKIVDKDGNVVTEYQYDAWGNLIGTSGILSFINPYTYRGYRYDDRDITILL
ncbi:MAG: DNRLRE domain-containing protein [Bacilli bacterium]